MLFQLSLSDLYFFYLLDLSKCESCGGIVPLHAADHPRLLYPPPPGTPTLPSPHFVHSACRTSSAGCRADKSLSARRVRVRNEVDGCQRPAALKTTLCH